MSYDAAAPLWEPSDEQREAAKITEYMLWLADNDYGTFPNYQELWTWSVAEIDRFWESIWRFCEVKPSRSYTHVLGRREMPGAEWFLGARLNFGEHLFRHRRSDRPAILWRSETSALCAVGWDELERQTAALASRMRALGVGVGDRVVAVLPNIPETVVSFLATVSLGAIWSVCSPEFGISSIIDRFQQLEPKLLIAADGYHHKGKTFQLYEKIAALQAELPTLDGTILVPYIGAAPTTGKEMLWEEAVDAAADLAFEQVPSEHPLWIVYTSGTSGLPKPIVHSHAGVLIERLKAVLLQGDVRPDDIYFWFTTTSWVMWNITVSALLGCSTIVLFDGSPWYPSPDVLWQLVEESKATIFGTSAGFLHECMRQDLAPGRDHDLSRVRSIGVTAATLSPEGFDWVYDAVKDDVWLASSSGGTEVATGFVVGSPVLPVYAGEIQCRGLGVDVRAVDDLGDELLDEIGELVIAQPMPSMPLKFWNDPDGDLYRRSYFERFPGLWYHGDFVKLTSRGSAVIYGRSDATINRGGVRVGTSEIYRAVERLPGVVDSLVVELPRGTRTEVVLFIVTTSPVTPELETTVNDALRADVSPRHIPDKIIGVPEIPRTLNGKKLEVPIKRILLGTPIEAAVTVGAVSNPAALEFFARLSGVS